MSHAHLPIPPAETATDPVHSTADMGQRWRAVMGPLGFSEKLLWIGFVGSDRRMVKALSQVTLGGRPRPRLADSVMSGVSDALAGFRSGTTVALLLTRPGRGPISDADRTWSELLTAAAARFGVPLEPIFRANDQNLVLVT
jgi:hypothetical protein